MTLNILHLYQFCLSILHLRGDNHRTLKTVLKLQVDWFLKTMRPNVFKLCVIVTSHDYYCYTLLPVTCNLLLGHKVSVKFES